VHLLNTPTQFTNIAPNTPPIWQILHRKSHPFQWATWLLHTIPQYHTHTHTHLSGPLQYPIQFTNIVPKYKSWHPRQIFIHLLPMMQTCTSNTHDQHIIISYNSPASGHIISCSVIFPILDVFLEITNTTIFYNGQNSWWLFIILSPMAQTRTFDTGDHHTISWCIFVCTLAYHDISIILGVLVEITNTTILYLLLPNHISELDLLYSLNIFYTLIRLSQSLTENLISKLPRLIQVHHLWMSGPLVAHCLFL
jgi:hypothetical protein